MVSSNSTIDFNKEKVILVEGGDDEQFFKKLLERLNISDIQIFKIGGKGKLRTEFINLPLIHGFSMVRRLVVIIDADNDFNGTKQSVINTINTIFQADPNPEIFSLSTPSIAYFIMPNNQDRGMMETLCINSVATKPTMEIVDRFIIDVDHDVRIIEKPRVKDKAKAQAYLSIMPEVAFGMSYGIVKNYWDLDFVGFRELIEFIISI